MNPYARFLGDRDPREVIARTAGELQALADRLGPEGLERVPAPGKWNAKSILCHLADCEVVFAFRLRQAVAEPYHTIQPFDQDLWANSYATADAGAALATFRSVRAWNVSFVAGLSAEELAKKLTHPERGEMTIQTVVETMAGHDLNHMEQLERIAAARATA